MNSLMIETIPVSKEKLQERLAAVNKIEQLHLSQIQWSDCKDPEEYREMRRIGSNGFPKPYTDPAGKTMQIFARDKHPIELRILAPKSPSKGVFLHFHAGGFVIGSAKSYDAYLGDMANSLSMIVVSVEYRLAPEHPYPTGQHDSLDAAIFALSPEGEAQLGGPLRILGGESAGGYLTVWVALALRDQHGVDVRSKIAALVPSYGLFDISYTPSVMSHKRRALLGKEETIGFVEAEFGRIPLAERKSPEVSPFFADLSGMPPALFIVGTEDPLLDDSVVMASRWSLAGNLAELRIFPGACHAFTLFPMGELTKEGNDAIIKFVSSKLL